MSLWYPRDYPQTCWRKPFDSVINWGFTPDSSLVSSLETSSLRAQSHPRGRTIKNLWEQTWLRWWQVVLLVSCKKNVVFLRILVFCSNYSGAYMVDYTNSVGTHKNFLRSSLFDISDNKHRNFHKKNFPHRSKIYTHNIDMFFLMTPDRILVVHDHEFCVIGTPRKNFRGKPNFAKVTKRNTKDHHEGCYFWLLKQRHQHSNPLSAYTCTPKWIA